MKIRKLILLIIFTFQIQDFDGVSRRTTQYKKLTYFLISFRNTKLNVNKDENGVKESNILMHFATAIRLDNKQFWSLLKLFCVFQLILKVSFSAGFFTYNVSQLIDIEKVFSVPGEVAAKKIINFDAL